MTKDEFLKEYAKYYVEIEKGIVRVNSKIPIKIFMRLKRDIKRARFITLDLIVES